VALAWAAPVLATALGATATLQAGLRAEVRDSGGGPSGARVVEAVPYEVAPAAGLQLEVDRRLTLGASFNPSIFLLAPPGGGRNVHSTAAYGTGALFAAWRADERLSLTLSGSASRGTLQISPLSQLSQSSAPSGGGTPPDQQPAPLDPAAGVRSARHGAASGRIAGEWRSTENLSVGGAAGYWWSGGLRDRDRLAFPAQQGASGEASARLSLTARDSLSFSGSYARTELEARGATAFLALLARSEHQFLPDVAGSLGVGLVATLEEAASATRAGSRVAPQAEVGMTKAASPQGRGLGATIVLGYAPYLDPYANRVRQRLSGRATAEWLAGPRLRISGALAGATAVTARELGPSVGAAELGVWTVRPDLELGLTARAGLQESGVPAALTWQWGISIGIRWTARGSL